MGSWRQVALAAAVAVPTLALASASVSADGETVAPFTLAIVRQDGILTPFATWTGKAYENAWPVPRKEIDTPITVEEVPKRWWGKPGPTLSWRVLRTDGSTVDARVTAPAWFPAHCLQGIGLRTSLTPPKPLPPISVQPYPKLGVAVSRGLDLRAVETVNPAGPLASVLVRSIRDSANAEETRIVKRHQLDGWLHPYSDSERPDVPIRIEALYRAPADAGGRFTYYFEAVKQYPIRAREGLERTVGPGGRPVRPRTCELVTFLTGWFTTTPDTTTITPSLLRVRLTSCDYESVDVMLPLAWVVLRGRPVWIAQLSGWGREKYVVLDPQSKDETNDVLFSSNGGYCESKRS